MTNMLKELELPTLQERRKENRLSFLYKISRKQIPAIPSDTYLKPVVNKRKRKETKKIANYVTSNNVTKYQLCHDNCYKYVPGNTVIYNNSFFPRTISEWNQLRDTSAPSLETFKELIRKY